MLTISRAQFFCLCALASFPLFADTINYTGVNGEQQYTVATTGIYQIVAYGAEGGAIPGSRPGGVGAEIGGDFALSANEVLDLYIGQAGQNSAGGGGGGTFVLVNGNSSPLVVAGGGGGAGLVSSGGAAATSSSGSDGGGAAGTGLVGGGGGGGFSGDGGSATEATGGKSFANGLAGGISDGGYGGGGGTAFDAGGGGGGYQGGAGGSGLDGGGGAGGGSYLDPSATSAILQVGNTGNGFVNINLVQATPTAPEPASIALLALGLLAIPAFRRKPN